MVAYAYSTPPEKVFVRKYLGYLIVWPLYTLFLFYVRVSAGLRTLTESAQWTVHLPLLEKLETLHLRQAAQGVRSAFLGLFT
jgi:hypothetical protein